MQIQSVALQAAVAVILMGILFSMQNQGLWFHFLSF